ncbi:TPA: hypothetical protein MIQ52_002195 [Klebsiella aerogenes]|nr:hypothetical protein [Klebsiella aerogenes]HBY1540547.1 hypothetical protein [Klebsiella aerogenes]HBY1604418.1 hypothetical protein [Klebsiella aerogenes]HBY1642030.1 hypothetical protein [Klebsiella aerogenes]
MLTNQATGPDVFPEAVLRTFSGLRVCSPGKRSATGEDIPRTAKNPAPSGTGFFLFDAWQFMAGVLPATLRAVAAQRSNPLPADLSCSGERSPTNNR